LLGELLQTLFIIILSNFSINKTAQAHSESGLFYLHFYFQIEWLS